MFNCRKVFKFRTRSRIWNRSYSCCFAPDCSDHTILQWLSRSETGH